MMMEWDEHFETLPASVLTISPYELFVDSDTALDESLEHESSEEELQQRNIIEPINVVQEEEREEELKLEIRPGRKRKEENEAIKQNKYLKTIEGQHAGVVSTNPQGRSSERIKRNRMPPLLLANPIKAGQLVSSQNESLPPSKQSNQTPKFPLRLKGVTIHCLGSIVYERERFHSKKYIWPIGFKSSRMYASLRDPRTKCEYTSEILDGGNEPHFKVTCDDDGLHPVIATSSSGAWTEIIKRLNKVRDSDTGKRQYTTVSGPEMFGFAHPTVIRLIQNLPHSRECKNYVFRDSTKKGKRESKKKDDPSQTQ